MKNNKVPQNDALEKAVERHRFFKKQNTDNNLTLDFPDIPIVHSRETTPTRKPK